MLGTRHRTVSTLALSYAFESRSRDVAHLDIRGPRVCLAGHGLAAGFGHGGDLVRLESESSSEKDGKASLDHISIIENAFLVGDFLQSLV
jgi:hypothetical protein